jgi:hypothetical protein
MSIKFSGRLATIPASLLLFSLALIAVACSDTGKITPPSVPSGPLTGNWQFNLLQDYPRPPTNLAVTGTMSQTNEALTGSMQGPTIVNTNGTINCGGVGAMSGTISGQNVNLSVNPGGSSFNFTGTISSDNQSMSGDYQALGGACFTAPTSGTWNAFLVPPVNGSFTGTISNSAYMAQFTGVTPAAPVAITGTITQSNDMGASDASLTGTISATGYPCFATASLTGTISGENVVLAIYGYQGTQIGNLNGTLAPADTSTGSNGTAPQLSGSLKLGFSTSTGSTGPCPPLATSGQATVGDSGTIAVTFQ